MEPWSQPVGLEFLLQSPSRDCSWARATQQSSNSAARPQNSLNAAPARGSEQGEGGIGTGPTRGHDGAVPARDGHHNNNGFSGANTSSTQPPQAAGFNGYVSSLSSNREAEGTTMFYLTLPPPLERHSRTRAYPTHTITQHAEGRILHRFHRRGSKLSNLQGIICGPMP